MAPEILNNSGYNELCDIWSCGVIMYFLLTKIQPFKGGTKEETIKLIKIGKIDKLSLVWKQMSEDAKDLLVLLLDRNPSTRINAQTALEHKWFKQLLPCIKFDIGNDELANSLRNLQKYSALCVLQKSALSYIASQLTDAKEEEKWCKLFNMIDKNKDGKVSKSDLRQTYEELYNNEELAEKESSEILDKADFNGNEQIDYTGNIFFIYRVFNSKYGPKYMDE